MKGRTSGLEDFTILDPSLNHHHRHRRHPIYQVITWVECADERSLGSFPACQRLPSPSSCRASGRAQPSFGLSSTVFFASASIQGPSRRFGLKMRPQVSSKEAPAGHKCGVHAPSAFANDRAGVEGCSWPAEESLSEPDVSARLEVGEAGRAVARRLLFRSLALSLRLARTSRARVRKARGFIST